MPPILTWSKICADRSLRDLPFKVELTPRGILEMSPARPRHGEYQGKITSILSQLLPEGRIIPECPVESPEGEVRVPDVAWIHKREFYAALGCHEFWTCTETGAVTFMQAATGETLAASAVCPAFPSTIDLG